MFYYISGILTYKDLNFVVLDVQGVGYKLYTGAQNIESMQLNHPYKMFTYMHIREDLMDIFGFLSEDELSTFEMLLSVNGVGPKAALSILSSVPAPELLLAIMTGDHKAITKAQGIGGKLAQRIVLELKDKLKNVDATDITPASNTASIGEKNDAISALIGLGYSASEAQKAVMEAMKNETKLEDIIKSALKSLAR